MCGWVWWVSGWRCRASVAPEPVHPLPKVKATLPFDDDDLFDDYRHWKELEGDDDDWATESFLTDWRKRP